jgi:zinc protease
VLREIEREIKRMASGRVTKAELKRCQVRLCAGRRMSLQTNGAQAMQVALSEHYGQPLDDGSDFEARINAVTVKGLASFARRYLNRQACTQVVVRP